MNVAASSGTAQVTGYAIPIGRVLRIADAILAGPNGTSVTSSTQLTGLLADLTPGDQVSTGWVDSAGTSHHAGVTLGRAPVA